MCLEALPRWGALLPSHLQRTGWPFQKSSAREVCLLQPAICSQLLSQLPLPVWSLLPQLGGGGDRFLLWLGVGAPGKHRSQADAYSKWSLKEHSLLSPVCSLPSRLPVPREEWLSPLVSAGWPGVHTIVCGRDGLKAGHRSQEAPASKPSPTARPEQVTQAWRALIAPWKMG